VVQFQAVEANLVQSPSGERCEVRETTRRREHPVFDVGYAVVEV
jgi:hypothetical protein